MSQQTVEIIPSRLGDRITVMRDSRGFEHITMATIKPGVPMVLATPNLEATQEMRGLADWINAQRVGARA